MGEPYWADESVTLHLGDCLAVLPSLPDGSVDAVVCDPPYGLEFMGREWDGADGFRRSLNEADAGRDSVFGRTSRTSPEYRTGKPSAARIRERVDGRTNPAEGKSVTVTPEAYIAGQPFQAWCQAWARECLRVLKPGGWLLAFGGTRTWHRLTCGIEDAGFEIRDSVADLTGIDGPGLLWAYGSGFPKSLDVPKAIDKLKRRDYVLAAVELGLEIPGNNLHDWTKAEHSPGDEWWERFKAHIAPEDWQRIERAAIGRARGKGSRATIGPVGIKPEDYDITAPATEDAARWEGWGTALKPSYEPVVVARKPAGENAILVEIGSHLDRLEREWLSLAKGAAASSPPTRPASPEARDASAPASAATRPEACQESATRTGKVDASSAATDTSPSTWTAGTFLSTVTSWRQCLAELCELMSTSITGTTSSTTTGLRTLSSSLSRLTAGNMAASLSPVSGLSSFAGAADALFAAAVLNSRAILALSAGESATGGTPTNSPDEDAPPSRSWEPIVVARKPVRGTVARNVLEFGTGALNIAGCRVDSEPGRQSGWSLSGSKASSNDSMSGPNYDREPKPDDPAGRWPSNVVLGAEAAAELDRQSGVLTSGANPTRRGSDKFRDAYGDFAGQEECMPQRGTDSGGASRFFPVFRYEQVCVLYGMLSECERVSGAAAKSQLSGQRRGSAVSAASASLSQQSAVSPDQLTLSAPTAGSPSEASPATIPSTAHATAPMRSSGWSAPHVGSAGSLCDSCATAIALSLAATRRGQSPMPTLGLPSTDAFSERILSQNLALFAEALESSGTTSTTTALRTSLGCVVAAISACITRESDSGTRKSGPPPFKYVAKAASSERPRLKDGTAHPTVKPVDLMAWLVRLVTPPGGLVLDPFAGSGTTAEACIVEGFRCVLIEKDPSSAELIKTRLRKPIQPAMFGLEDVS